MFINKSESDCSSSFCFANQMSKEVFLVHCGKSFSPSLSSLPACATPCLISDLETHRRRFICEETKPTSRNHCSGRRDMKRHVRDLPVLPRNPKLNNEMGKDDLDAKTEEADVNFTKRLLSDCASRLQAPLQCPWALYQDQHRGQRATHLDPTLRATHPSEERVRKDHWGKIEATIKLALIAKRCRPVHFENSLAPQSSKMAPSTISFRIDPLAHEQICSKIQKPPASVLTRRSSLV